MKKAMLVGCALGAALSVGGPVRAQSQEELGPVPSNFPVNEVTAYRAGGTATFALSNSNVQADLSDLAVTFTLAAASPVLIVYNVASDSGGAGFLITTVTIDGVELAGMRTVSNATNPAPYFNNGATGGTLLGPGTHTVRVRYRSNVGGTNQPAGNDYNARSLMVIVVS